MNQSPEPQNTVIFQESLEALQLTPSLRHLPELAPKPAESPRFSPTTGNLLVTDIDGKRVLVYDQSGALQSTHSLNKRIGSLARTNMPHIWLASFERDLVLLDERTGKIQETFLSDIEPNEAEIGAIRLNDGDVVFSPSSNHPLSGHFLVGGISETKPSRSPVGSLYAISPAGDKMRLLSGFCNSNGIARVSNDLFHADTAKRKVTRYQVEEKGESVSLTPIAALQFEGEPTPSHLPKQSKSPAPDGLLTSKCERFLVIALYYGGMVVVVDTETFQHRATIALPVPSVTACELIGDELFITTGAAEGYPEAGGLFGVSLAELGVQGKEREQFCCL